MSLESRCERLDLLKNLRPHLADQPLIFQAEPPVLNIVVLVVCGRRPYVLIALMASTPVYLIAAAAPPPVDSLIGRLYQELHFTVL